MIVPTGPAGASAEQPSEANLLMALAEMHKQGRFANLTEGGSSNPRAMARGIFQDIEKGHKPRAIDRELDPGERVPDRGQGGTQRRDVRGI